MTLSILRLECGIVEYATLIGGALGGGNPGSVARDSSCRLGSADERIFELLNLRPTRLRPDQRDCPDAEAFL
jgi:hypothetical protein